jgi:glyoxylase-like metal-dependent hydrolase (beta-lactamase superfamily II)
MAAGYGLNETGNNMKIKRLVGGNLESNGYILTAKGGGDCYIVDPGYNGERFLREASDAGLRILGILLTHHHYDHVGGVRKIKASADCPVYIHRDDADAYKDGADVLLSGGETIQLQSEDILALHTPGHTRGSLCFFSGKSGLCFTGDTLFNVDLGRTDLGDGSAAAMERSIRETVSRWPDGTVIYPGHGAPCNMKFVRVHNGEYLEIMGEGDRYRPWDGGGFML